MPNFIRISTKTKVRRFRVNPYYHRTLALEPGNVSSIIFSGLGAAFFLAGLIALGGWPNDMLDWVLLVFSPSVFGLSLSLLASVLLELKNLSIIPGQGSAIRYLASTMRR